MLRFELFVENNVQILQPVTIDDINDDTSDLTNMDDEQSITESRPAEIPPRQRGCDDFESLSPVTKINVCSYFWRFGEFPDWRFLPTQYCSDVLLLEAIRQILLWRTGARTSAELLSPQEEQCLFEKGEVLLRETDWVFDIMRLRKVKQSSMMKNRDPKKSGRRNSLGRTASEGRMRRQVNYAEWKA